MAGRDSGKPEGLVPLGPGGLRGAPAVRPDRENDARMDAHEHEAMHSRTAPRRCRVSRVAAEIVIALAWSAVSVGCGAPAARPSGTITAQGVPVAGAEVVFTPQADDRGVRVGTTGSDGRYTLDHRGQPGMLHGPCRVVVTVVTDRRGRPLPEGEEGVAIRSDAARTRTTMYEFDRDVPPGVSTIDLDFDEARRSGR